MIRGWSTTRKVWIRHERWSRRRRRGHAERRRKWDRSRDAVETRKRREAKKREERYWDTECLLISEFFMTRNGLENIVSSDTSHTYRPSVCYCLAAGLSGLTDVKLLLHTHTHIHSLAGPKILFVVTVLTCGTGGQNKPQRLLELIGLNTASDSRPVAPVIYPCHPSPSLFTNQLEWKENTGLLFPWHLFSFFSFPSFYLIWSFHINVPEQLKSRILK